ncbi:MAG: hypothetical protein HUJ52_00325, partial [Malacoplasma sp.]|nr:hypothetical protein [Malacoplasma sp.]
TSNGMLCGHNEVDAYFNDCLNPLDANGIMEIDPDFKIGDTNISKILGLDETIYELSIPTNRNDQAGAYFVESDFAAYFKTKCNLQVAVNNNKKLEGYNVILDNKLSQYSSLIKISGVKHKMPSWKIKRDLLNNGVKIGCLTRTLINEITYNTGIAPLFFACDAVPKTIKQRYAKKGETITIKGVEYTLDTKDIVLVDDKDQIIALDGIEVADGYGVSPDKTEIMLFISNTYFAFPRNTAIRLGISTYVTKFSKYTISKFQCNLFLRDLNKKFKNVESTNLFNEIEKDITLNFDANECVKFIGTSQLTRAKVIQYIKQWKFKYDAKNKTVTVPGWRTYLENQWDLFEEVLKFFTVDDLESIPVNTFTNISSRHYDEYYFVSKLREMLNYAHILEAKTYNLTSKQELQNFNIFDLPSVYEVNPCSNTARQFMRLSTINELVKVMNYNASHKVPLQPVFELQKIYSDKFYYNLTILAPARVTADHINEIHFNFNTFGLKGILEKMCNIFNCELDLTKANNKYLYPTDTLAINYKGELIGYIGAIKSSYLKQYKLANEVLYVLTINIDKLIANYTKKEFKFKPISNVLPTFKDITVDTTTSTDINKMSQEFATLGFIEKFKFIKAYQIDDATMAYTIRFALINDLGSTLTKEEIDADIKQIVAIIKKYKGEVKGM